MMQKQYCFISELKRDFPFKQIEGFVLLLVQVLAAPEALLQVQYFPAVLAAVCNPLLRAPGLLNKLHCIPKDYSINLHINLSQIVQCSNWKHYLNYAALL